ncbi:MAG TPA: TnsA endonuclease N-terminal domain-containing protein [Rhodanobacter sp.]|nr:TnsA endonuclease N-terminal domain-containing protein [Rhodanobacter sp.]
MSDTNQPLALAAALSSTGDLIAAELREDFEKYDFAIPFILREADENAEHLPIDIAALPPFSAMSRAKLAELLGKGDTFTSQGLQSSTLFGDYRVDGVAMNVRGYNELLSQLTRRLSQTLNYPLPKGNKIARNLDRPYLQINIAVLAMALDDYIRERLFNEPFEPFEDEGWRLLLLDPVLDHIVKTFGLALVRTEEHTISGSTEVRHRRLSEVTKLMVRESASLEVTKCIYTRLPYPTRSGGLERAFIEWAQLDAGVEAFCKISENRHDFVRLRYVKNDGLPAFYIPDFLVRTVEGIYLVETKAQEQVSHPNVQRKLRAATTWCERINTLDAELRGERTWHYALIGESLFHDWREKGARLGDLLTFSRARAAPTAQSQGDLAL